MKIYISNIKHKKFAEQISKCIDESAKMRGTGIARRTPEYIIKKTDDQFREINNYQVDMVISIAIPAFRMPKKKYKNATKNMQPKILK